MKIIVLVIPTLKMGGAERVMSELANKWHKDGYEIHLILLAKAPLFYSIDNGIHVHELQFENRGPIGKLISEVKTFWRLRRLFKKLQPDVILSFMTKYNTFVIFSSMFLNLKVFVSDRSNPYKTLPFVVSRLRKWTYPFAEGIIAQTNAAQNKLEKDTKHNNISVIPNPVREIKTFPQIKRKKLIINVGRMIPEKGQEYLLKAFSKISYEGWQLVILGDGSLRKEIENRAETLGITNNIYLPGRVENVDMWLARSSIFAFPSVSEGFPNALLEAMAAGLPVVSFDCPVGPADIIEDGKNGFLVELKNENELADRLSILIRDKTKREVMGENAKKVTIKYNRDAIADKYLNFCTN